MMQLRSVFAVSLVISSVYGQPGEKSSMMVTSPAMYCNTDIGDDATYSETIESSSSHWNGYARHVESSGCPNYKTSPIKYDTTANVFNPVKDIPAYPCFSDANYDLLCESSSIGILLNGVVLFSQFQNIASCPENNDAVQDEGDDFDECGGHPSDERAGEEYHYHNLPSCLADQLDDYSNVTSHSPLYGWAYDGFPIYGPHTVNGAEIYLCTHVDADPDYCLDECGGTDQYEIDGFLYHYHLQGPLSDLTSIPLSPLPSTDRAPYSIGCFRGVPSEIDTGGTCESNGTTSDYTAVATDGVTEVYNSSRQWSNGTYTLESTEDIMEVSSNTEDITEVSSNTEDITDAASRVYKIWNVLLICNLLAMYTIGASPLSLL